MAVSGLKSSAAPASLGRAGADFSEAAAWSEIGDGWKQLGGGFRRAGFSIEWHDFAPEVEFDWAQSFHPNSLEICLNLTGYGKVRAGESVLVLEATCCGFYFQGAKRLEAVRRSGERHQFITLELTPQFLEQRLVAVGSGACLKGLKNRQGEFGTMVSASSRLTCELQQLAMSLRQPPVWVSAHQLWYEAKVLELAAALLFEAPPREEMFCARQKRLSQERVGRVVAILKQEMAEPPSLEELGRRVGCSHFYLTRLFTQEMGKTISVFLRELRMERAAELLREGRLNVTEVAMEVGYSSPSHFSQAFREHFGRCPGLY
jgi:AraC-like DNA-binding protein